MPIYISNRELGTPGVSASLIVDTAQLPPRTRAAIIKQIRRGVFSKSPLGLLAKRLVDSVHGTKEVELPCIRWYGPILVRKAYMEEQAVKDVLDAMLVTARLRGVRHAYVEDGAERFKNARAYAPYMDFMYYQGLNDVINMLSFEASERWRAISAPVLAAIERGDVITCCLSS